MREKLTKKEAADLRREYFALLDKKLSEQSYQRFIETHTEFVPREFLQNHGLHFQIALRKLSFGADYKSDFFYFSKSSDDWHAVLVELEKPQSRFFRHATNVLHQDFQSAIQQINSWRAWLANANNAESFLRSTLIHSPPHMAINPTAFKYVLVMGRRSEYEQNPQRRAIVRAQEREDFKIVTYDSLAENIDRHYPLYIGSKRNEFIDIAGDHVLDSMIFSWMDASQLRVTRKFRENLKKGPFPWHKALLNGKTVVATRQAAKRVRVRSI